MRVLICGGGVAGLTLAYWLRRRGFEPVVVERASHGRLGGYGIDFFGTGYDVATRMGIIDRLAPHQLPVDSVDFVDASGKATARLTNELLAKVIQGPHLGLMHSGLEGALLDVVQDDVEIRYGDTVIAVRDTAAAVEVDFAGGDTEAFDLLVGADGIHSVTRGLVFGPEAEFARYLGCHLASYAVPDRYDLGRIRAHYTEPGRQAVVYPTGRTGELIALLLFKAPYGGSVPRGRRLDLLRATFDGMGWITPSLLADAPSGEAVFMDTMTQIVMPTWHHGRVALIGDACGCMTMVSAQGVSMAMAGAYILAEALHTQGDHARAFRSYEERMRREVTRRQRNALFFARSLVPGTRTGLIAQNLISRLIMRDAFAPVLRRQFGVGTILPPQDAITAIDFRRD
ncbi:FAD-dependent monooxygenase [Nonomuraea sp. NEAU-A123]|uniref:FAD-dependent monooxygenase n=1 Tax=Nonomuraea sp. NEAU-A123 TaxID=2839649 RepID=UPI001BE46FF8|nr:FAD-dependent monooxygenase [Nonomuraea sp. NEAU-A123]MBT2233709.1 FAD-dependent monooxygenase [Nonomuraea sp. NEAU-A123]